MITEEKTLNPKRLFKILIALIIIITIICVIILVQFAWSKYMSSLKGNNTVDMAKWSFKLTGGDIIEGETINFANTRLDGDKSIADEVLAPGTSGKFEIGIDPRGTETNLIYKVNIHFTNKPKNLKIYLEDEEIYINNDVFNYEKFLNYNETQTIQTQVYSWEWKFETGNTKEEIDFNNIEDSKSINETMYMQIEIIGMQVDASGVNILYHGNGATAGEISSHVSMENVTNNYADNFYKREYEVYLNANGGFVENNKIVSEYEFSHWSTDNTNQNVLYFSTDEKGRWKFWIARISTICRYSTIS